LVLAGVLESFGYLQSPGSNHDRDTRVWLLLTMEVFERSVELALRDVV